MPVTKTPSPLNKTIRLTAADLEATVRAVGSTDQPQFSTIYHGDVLEFLGKIQPSTFDLIIADPPYNLGIDFGNDSDNRTDDEYRSWVRSWIDGMVSAGGENASFYVFCDWRYSGFYQTALEDAGLRIMNRITWKREKGRGAARNWKQNMEDIWFAVKDPKEYTFNIDAVKLRKKVIAPYRENGEPKDWMTEQDGSRIRMTHPSNIWTDFTVPFWSMPENTEHPTQKPEALIERIIAASSNRGDAVLDLFSGSGTTSVIARKLGRKFIGVEMNEEYVRLGMKRLALIEESSPDLFQSGSE